jgi:hypothetical protein
MTDKERLSELYGNGQVSEDCLNFGRKMPYRKPSFYN